MREWTIELTDAFTDNTDFAQSLRSMEHIYEKRGYKVAFTFESPSREDVAGYGLTSPETSKVLYIDGQSTGWVYYEHGDKGFDVEDGHFFDIPVESREHAEKLTILLYDVAAGPFDRVLGVDREVWYPPAHYMGDGRGVHVFSVREPINDVYVAVGTRPSNASYGASRILDTVYERSTLEVDDRVIISPAGVFATDSNGDLLHEVKFDRPPEPRHFEKSYDHGNARFAFPLSRLAERSITSEWERIVSSPLSKGERFDETHARIVENGRTISEVVDRKLDHSRAL